jgi:CRP-like cAMP-binding protein
VTTSIPHLRTRNRLLARLPDDEYAELLPYLKTVRFRARRAVVRLHTPPAKVYFPGDGVCLMSCVTQDGRTTGVALVGKEGMIDSRALDGDLSRGMTVTAMIAERDAQMIDAAILGRAVTRLPVLDRLVSGYSHAFCRMLMQSVVCNALHSVEQRCARCLLDCRDRLGRQELPLTHETLADLLGVRRESITLSAGILEQSGLIERGRRRISITDPAGLMNAACECYVTVKGLFDHVFPPQ